MQQDTMDKNGLAIEKPVKAAWSKPEIEELSIAGGTEAKPTGTSEASFTAPS